MCCSFWVPALERSLRGSFVDLGVLERSQLAVPPAASERFITVFYGRLAANVDILRAVGRRPDAGYDRPTLSSTSSWRNAPGGDEQPDAASLPGGCRADAGRGGPLARRLRRLRRDTEAWWGSVVFGPGTVA